MYKFTNGTKINFNYLVVCLCNSNLFNIMDKLIPDTFNLSLMIYLNSIFNHI